MEKKQLDKMINLAKTLSIEEQKQFINLLSDVKEREGSWSKVSLEKIDQCFEMIKAANR